MPATATLFRKLALSLLGAIESSHMNHPDFRFVSAEGKSRIFATLSGEEKGCGVLMLTLEQQAAFCEELPEVFQPVQGGWGRMGSTYVHLHAAGRDTLLGALTAAHHNAVVKLESAKPKSTVTRKPAVVKSLRKTAAAKPKIKK